MAADLTTPIAKAASLDTAASAPQSALRTALAGLIGNVLEWFDFAVYGYFASDIGRQFFRNRVPTAQQLLAFAVFAIGFFARPIGSLVLGMVGDRIGRRALLTLSIALMGGSTLILGLLPTYQQIGLAAPLLLVTMRLIQGFSVGGEFTGSMVYTTESASPMTRGLISSSTAAGVTIGFILGSGSAWLVNVLPATEKTSPSWGWRIPFVASVLLCVLGWFLRRGLHETAEGLKAVASRPPLLPSLIADWLPMVRTFGIVATTNAAYYLTFTYVVERRKNLHGGGSGFPPGEHRESDPGAHRETARRLAVRSHGPPQADADPHRRDYGPDLSGAAADAVRHAVAVHVRPASAGCAARHGTRPPGRDGRRDFPAPHQGHLDELRLQHHSGAGRRDRPARLGLAHPDFGVPLAPAYYVMLHGAVGLALLWPMQETNTRTLSD